MTIYNLPENVALAIRETLARRVPRASQQRQELEARGICGAAADLLVKEDAYKRHFDRIQGALYAAIAWALCYEEEVEAILEKDYLHQAYELAGSLVHHCEMKNAPQAILTDAWAILAIDAGGVGGRHDAEGAGTARHPGLHLLGKGRKQASDGEAWDAAIAAAATRLADKLRDLGRENLRLTPGTGEREGELGVGWAGGWEAVPCLHPRWVAAEAARQLLRAPAGPEAPAWAAAYNRAKARLAETES